MNFIFCLKGQIYQCPKTPEHFEALIETVKQLFKDVRLEKFSLSYPDSEGDLIALRTQNDFLAMTETMRQTEKIIINIEPQDEIPNAMLTSKISLPKSEMLMSLEDFRIERLPDDHFQDIKHTIPSHEASQMINKSEKPRLDEPVIEISTIFIDKEEKEPSQQERCQVYQEETKCPETVKKEENNDVIETSDMRVKSNLKTFILQILEEKLPNMVEKYFQNSEKEDMITTNEIKKSSTSISIPLASTPTETKLIPRAKIIRYLVADPEVVTTSDELIYLDVVYKNIGTETLPSNTFLYWTGGLYGEMTKIPPIEAQRQYKVRLIIRGPKKCGNFTSTWRFAYINDSEAIDFFSEEIVFCIVVTEKEYSPEIKEKAYRLQEFFPQTEIGVFLEFVNQDPQRNIEELFDEYLLNNPFTN